MPHQAIQAHAERIDLPYLVHFTRVVNLPSILQHGLYPVSRTVEVGVVPVINDELRLDGHPDGTSLSIAFPNHRMFWKYRQEYMGVDWVVLGIEPEVLWTKDCAYCCHNAADSLISDQPLENLKTPLAFASMFDEIEGEQPRGNQRLKPYEPTDVQAEVLVFDVIEPRLIFGVVFGDTRVRDAHLSLLSDREALIDSKFFSARYYKR